MTAGDVWDSNILPPDEISSIVGLGAQGGYSGSHLHNPLMSLFEWAIYNPITSLSIADFACMS